MWSTIAAPDAAKRASAQQSTIPEPLVPPGFCALEPIKSRARIMIVDDEPLNIRVAQQHLKDLGYEKFLTLTSGAQSLEEIDTFHPDVMLLDVMMPEVSGIDVLRSLRANPHYVGLPVLVLTAWNDRDLRLQVLEAGATDLLTKPVDPSELAPRIRNALLTKAYQDHLTHYSEELELRIQERTAALEASRQDVVHCLARAAEYRDDDTGHHVLRVGRYSGLIAVELGQSPTEVGMLELAAQLHDVGKIGIPDAILLKPGKLDLHEFQQMQKHVGIGKRILDRVSAIQHDQLRHHPSIGASILDDCDSPLLSLARTIAQSHHERWDGSGYPLGLIGTDIPLAGRIVAVADVFDALSSRRPYKPAFPLDRCLAILEEGREKHFDPDVLDAFFRCRQQIVQVQMELMDT